MNKLTKVLIKSSGAVFAFVGFLNLAGLQSPTLSQSNGTNTINVELPSRGRPSKRSSGGKRGSCNKLEPPLIALVPLSQTHESSESVLNEEWESTLGLTVDESPTFWVYLPPLPPEVTEAELVIPDLLSEPLRIELPRAAGIIHISLPADRRLELNREYRWYFSLICDPSSPAKNPSVNSWIQRIEPSSNLESELAEVTAFEQLQVYAANSLWHETITGLAKMWCQNPRDRQIAQSWSELLRGIELSEIADAEILQCETLLNP